MANKNEEIILQDLLESDYPPVWTTDEDTSSLDSSESSSDDEEPRCKRQKIVNFVEQVIPTYTDTEFQRHFRMQRATAYKLIDGLQNSGFLPTHKDGREKISSEKAFLLSLWYMGNMETFRQIGDRFNCTESSGHGTIKRVIEFLLSIKNEIIKWPSAEHARTVSEKFKDIKGIENVVGCIDGSHIEIPKPKENQEAYCNRKGYHSVLLQGIVDSDKRFIDVICGEPGSMNDARLLRKSGIYKKMEEDPNFMGNYFLLGDSAYPNTHWIVSPFTDNGNLSREQKNFNYYHSATRIVVENAFGLLKNRFRRLRKLDNKDVLFCSKLIMAACVLHNICILYNDTVENVENGDCNQPEDPIAHVAVAGGNNRQIRSL